MKKPSETYIEKFGRQVDQYHELMNEAFEKTKKALESKPASQRTQKDIDEYNKWVNNINNAVNNYNNANNQMNLERQHALETWNGTVKKYLDTYMPKYKA